MIYPKHRKIAKNINTLILGFHVNDSECIIVVSMNGALA